MLSKLHNNYRRSLLAVSLTSLLSACGGGSNADKGLIVDPPPPPPTPTSIGLDAMGIKGPLQFAEINLYRYAPANTYGLGERVATGKTDAQAKFQGQLLNHQPSGYYVLEVSASDDTRDLTTGHMPVLRRLRILVSTEQLKAGEMLYATPLSTMALGLAHKRFQAGEDIGALTVLAGRQLKSVFAPGADNEVNLQTTPPLLTTSRDSEAKQIRSWQLRVANEAVAVLAVQLANSATEAVTPDEVLALMTEDLDDGVLNAQTPRLTLPYRDALAELLAKPLLSLALPGGNGQTLADTARLLRNETADTGYGGLDTSAFAAAEAGLARPYLASAMDMDSDGILNSEDNDDDADGVDDHADRFPLDSAESIDSDNDGIGNNGDLDDDNDGTPDNQDSFPLDASEQTDSDKDGVGNNRDTDDDNDGVLDVEDRFPLDPGESTDFDEDGIGDNADTDDDNDLVNDADDAFPRNAEESSDFDDDGIGDNGDLDDDNDGVADKDDKFPRNANETLDFDGDGIGDNSDLDDDNDGIADSEDNLTTFGLRASYSINQPLGFRIRARNDQAQVLKYADNWRLRYNIFDQAAPAEPLDRYANRQGLFDAAKQEWVVVLPAPESGRRLPAGHDALLR